MADADIPISAGTGTKVDTRTVGAGTDEHRQVVVVGDPATAAAVAAVLNAAPGASEYGAVVRVAGSTDVEGVAATDAAAPTSPVYVGGFASQNEPTQVSADGDLVPLWLTRKGAAVVQLSFPPNVAVTGTHGPHVQTVTALGPTAVVAAPAAGNSIHVTGVMATNSSATQTIVTLRDGTTDRLSSVLAPAGGGFVMTPISPPWKLTAATALNVTLSVAVTDVRLVVHYYIAP